MIYKEYNKEEEKLSYSQINGSLFEFILRFDKYIKCLNIFSQFRIIHFFKL